VLKASVSCESIDAPAADFGRANHALPQGFPVGPPPVITRFHEQYDRRKNRDDPANTKWSYEELIHSDRNGDAAHWQGTAKTDPY
jgi:hypothetical protein